MGYGGSMEAFIPSGARQILRGHPISANIRNGTRGPSIFGELFVSSFGCQRYLDAADRSLCARGLEQ